MVFDKDQQVVVVQQSIDLNQINSNNNTVLFFLVLLSLNNLFLWLLLSHYYLAFHSVIFSFHVAIKINTILAYKNKQTTNVINTYTHLPLLIIFFFKRACKKFSPFKIGKRTNVRFSPSLFRCV